MNVPGDDEEEFDPEKYKRDCEAEMQQYLDSVGRDTPEGKEIVRLMEEEGKPPPPPTNAEPEETQLIDLRLLKDSPLHRRHDWSPEELTALARGIAANGLKNPVDVRPDGGMFEIICGHRRVEAYRRLYELAQTDEERAKYRAIRAKVWPGASDVEVILKGIAEDLLREEFSAGDATRSIQVLRELQPQLDTPQKVSDATGLRPRRVGRHFQLGKAAAVVQQAAWEGIMVSAQGDGDEEAPQERRKLDLLAALEFSRLHTALSTKGAGRSEDCRERQEPTADGGEKPSGDSRHESSPLEEKESAADRQTRRAIERALGEGWSLREVKRYVDKSIGALHPTGPKNTGGRPRVPFKWQKRRLQVDVDRLDALDASQKAELRQVIEDILRRL